MVSLGSFSAFTHSLRAHDIRNKHHWTCLHYMFWILSRNKTDSFKWKCWRRSQQQQILSQRGEFTEATRLKSQNTQRQREVMSTEPEWPSSHLIYLTLTVSKQRGSSAAPESPPGPNIYSVVQMILNPPHSCATSARPGFKTPNTKSNTDHWCDHCQRLRLIMRL